MNLMNWKKFSDREEEITNRLMPLWLQWIIGGLALIGAAYIAANIIVEIRLL